VSGCPIEDLELYVSGALTEDEAARVAEHARSCSICAEEAAWLRAEERLFRARALELPAPPPFGGVLERLAAEPRAAVETPAPAPASRPAIAGRPRARRAAALLGLAAAAALLGVVFRPVEAPQPVVVSPEPAPEAAIGLYAEAPEGAGEAESCGGSGDTSYAGAAETEGACGEPPGEPEHAEGACDERECAIDLSVTCGEDRPLEE
jgi:hypothetical protein